MDTPLCRTRRTWLPNAQRVSLYSPTLQRTLRLRVSAAALRWVEVVGGRVFQCLSFPVHSTSQ